MLILVDLQNDYFHPQGKFYFEGSTQLVEKLQARIRRSLASEEPILYTLNLYHEEDGRARGERDWAATLFEPFHELLSGQTRLTKFYYGISAEEGKQVMDRFRDEPPTIIEVAGVETHLCVMANAVVFQNIFPKAELVIDVTLTGSGHPQLESHALAVMKGMNMRILNEEEATGAEGS